MSSSSLGMGRPSHGQGSSSQPRQSSAAVYNMFDPKQVQTFKEAFSMIDQDSDGWITEADLKTMLTSLGQAPTPKLLNSLLSSRPSTFPPAKPDSMDYNQGLNFTTFLTMMSEKLLELNPESELIEAFECFDEDDKGTTDGKELREWLGTVGDKMSKEEIDKLLSPPFADRHVATLFLLFALVKQNLCHSRNNLSDVSLLQTSVNDLVTGEDSILDSDE
ncbi:hypothetical protein PSTG_12541 [Puccinia striiformis f. sp. tritici PST-78]|uniref:EF-hand domain-containing protein n=1 Tax=Puccinia striiformis f. sp. tritici PST-78 TaxID=1165861 RepID=A0A0L0V4A8_9BASI|nr:hypothetical protein PSTG_12541 [Puccinia striiformis f. sp. tritici PST-78]